LVSPRDVPAPVHAPPFVAKPVSCYGRLKSGSIVLPLLLTALLVSLLQLLLSSSLDPTAPPSASVKPDDLQALLARDAKELALPKPSPPVPASPTLEQLLHIRDVVANLTLQEKITLLTGTALIHGYTGYVDGVPRLGVPALKMNDGPQGFRGPAGASTAWWAPPRALHARLQAARLTPPGARQALRTGIGGHVFARARTHGRQGHGQGVQDQGRERVPRAGTQHCTRAGERAHLRVHLRGRPLARQGHGFFLRHGHAERARRHGHCQGPSRALQSPCR
jgi:hypothetical protein